VTYSPWQAVGEHPHIEVVVTRLPAGRGWWLPDVQGIALDDRLDQAERRSVLEHELQHALAGDTCCRDVGPDGRRLHSRQERRADQRAAARLISLDALADALVWCLGPDEVAEHLHVDERTVRARLRHLTDEERRYIEQRLRARDGAA
jgi:Zn-dependent peptidase ImmA (M78 family)